MEKIMEMKDCSIEQYSNNVVEEIKKSYGSEYEINAVSQNKNNGVVYHGITIRTSNERITPNIYLDEMYDNNLTVEECAEKIIKIYEDQKSLNPLNRFDVDCISDFEKAKDKIIAKLVNKDANKELAKDAPHADFGDLMLIFYIMVDHSEHGDATALIKNNFLNEIWKDKNVTLADLIRIAHENQNKYHTLEIESIQNVIVTMLKSRGASQAQIDEFLNGPQNDFLFVVSTEDRMWGSVYLTDRDALKKISEKINSNAFYIIPSSIHEFLVMPDTGDVNENDLYNMVKEVNENELAPTEILSNNVYHYDTSKEEFIDYTDEIIPFVY